MWLALFSVVNKANIMMTGLKSATLSADVALEYEAQARFLRALAYHELLIHFAKPYNDGAGANLGMPIRTVAVNSASVVTEQMNVGRSTVAETYKFILDDLAFAEANISKTRKSITRVTLGAVLALQNRVYLHMSNWDKVIETGTKISGYSLTAAPDGVFSSFANNTESIFSMENSATDNAGNNGALPQMLNGKGRQILVISPILWNQGWWLQSDLRRTACCEAIVTTTTATPPVSFTNYYTKKYRDYSNNTDYTPLIRYAEVLLNMAEAYARKNDFTNALLNLNKVRNRAVTTVPDQFTSTSFTTQKEWITAVLQERRIEFSMEGRRWSDIHRLAVDPDFNTGGIPGKVANAFPASASGTLYKNDGSGYSGTLYYAFPYTDKRFLWPIPQNETNANPTLAAQQNPGW